MEILKRLWTWVQLAVFDRSDIYIGRSCYMKRWRSLIPFLRRKEWPAARLHLILRSDIDRELHDHPFDFVSIILWGGYFEHRQDGSCTWYGPGSVLFRQAETLHRLELEGTADERGMWEEKATLTLILRGAHRRSWGFMTERGWEHWAKFTKRARMAATGKTSHDRPYDAPSSVP